MVKADERQKTQIRVFFVQGRPGFGAKIQYALGKDHGLIQGSRNVYEPDPKKNAEDLAAAIRGARGGAVGVIGGFRVFGETRKAMMAGYAQAKALGGVLVDPLTGHRSDQDSGEMLDAALNRVHREVAEPAEGYSAIGSRGAEGRWKKIHHERVPAATAKATWKNPEILTDGQAAAMLGLGWSLSTLKNEFGVSGRKPGRRPSKTGAALAPSKVAKQKRRK